MNLLLQLIIILVVGLRYVHRIHNTHTKLCLHAMRIIFIVCGMVGWCIKIKG